jgi:hypothetical protein
MGTNKATIGSAKFYTKHCSNVLSIDATDDGAI